jgi:hypothetical protein
MIDMILVTPKSLAKHKHLFNKPASAGACPIKLSTAVIYSFRNKLMFVPGKPFRPSLMFVGEARSLP